MKKIYLREGGRGPMVTLDCPAFVADREIHLNVDNYAEFLANNRVKLPNIMKHFAELYALHETRHKNRLGIAPADTRQKLLVIAAEFDLHIVETNHD